MTQGGRRDERGWDVVRQMAGLRAGSCRYANQNGMKKREIQKGMGNKKNVCVCVRLCLPYLCNVGR